MKHKRTFRILIRKLFISGFYIFLFFGVSSVFAQQISVLDIWNAYRNYVVQVPTPERVGIPTSENVGTPPVVVIGNQPASVIYSQGPTGPQGPQGIQGPVGPRGPSGSSSSSGVSETHFNNQVNAILNSIENGLSNLSDSISESIDTDLLTVAGNSTIGGNLTVTGNITGNVIGTINPSFTLGSVPFQGATGLAEDNANLNFNDATNALTVGGALTALSFNGNTFTTGTGTLTLAAGKTLTASNTLTFAGTDGSTLDIGAGGTLGTNAYTSTAYAPIASPTFTGTVTIPTPFTLGATSVTSTGTQLNYLSSATGTTGTTSTNLVFSTSPTLVTPALGTPTALVLTNATGLPAASVLAGTFGTGAYVMDTSLTVPLINGSSADNGDITINGTSSATKTTSYVILQETGGNVGIGTTAPLLKLDVAGSGRFTGTATSVLTGTIDPAASTTVTGVGTLFTTELVVGDRITVTGETRTVTAIATNTSLTVDTAFSDNANDTSPDKLAAIFVARDSSNVVKTVINDLGNVGIGTTAPSSTLHVVGGNNTVTINPQGNGTAINLVNNSSNIAWGMGLNGTLTTDATLTLIGGADVVSEVASGAGRDFTWKISSGSTLMTLLNSGNLGIGTSTPLLKLDVAGSGRFTGSSTSVLTGSIDPAASTTVTGVGTLFTTELVVGDRITVTGETRTVTAIATNTSLTVDAAFSDNANDTSPDKLAAIFIARDSSNAVKTAINDLGNVGIGTTSPAYPLDIFSAAGAVPLNLKVNDTVTNAFQAVNSSNQNVFKIEQLTGAETKITLGASAGGSSLSSSSGTLVTNAFRTNFMISTGPTTGVFGMQGNFSGRYMDLLAGSTGIISLDGTTKGVNIGTGASYLNAPSPANGLLVEGSVGIGNPTPTYALDVLATGTGIIARFNSTNATGCTLADGGTITCTSDERMKKNIEDITYGLNTIKGLRPVLFNWKYEDDSTSKNLGFIAQEVEALVPKLIATDENGMKSLNTTAMIPILTKAIQEMDLQITEISNLDKPNSWRDSLVAWFGSVGNGIGDFVANRVRTKEICINDDNGETCINKTQLDALLLDASVAPIQEPDPAIEPILEEPVVEPTLEPEPQPEELPSLDPLPEETPPVVEESTPEPEPVVEPTPEPEPVIESIPEPVI